MERIYINTDGGARGNPGPAGIGVVIRKGDEFAAELSEYVGEHTNNWAEYEALIQALQLAHTTFGDSLKEVDVEIRMDSQLIVRQIEGIYKVKEPTLQKKYAEVTDLLSRYAPHAHFVHVPREENAEADRLVNQALDAAALL